MSIFSLHCTYTFSPFIYWIVEGYDSPKFVLTQNNFIEAKMMLPDIVIS